MAESLDSQNPDEVPLEACQPVSASLNDDIFTDSAKRGVIVIFSVASLSFLIYILISQTEWFQTQEQNAVAHDTELSERFIAIDKARKNQDQKNSKKPLPSFVHQQQLSDDSDDENEESTISHKDFPIKRTTFMQRTNRINKSTRFHPIMSENREKRSTIHSAPSLHNNCLNELKELHEIAANIHVLQTESLQVQNNQTEVPNNDDLRRKFPTLGKSNKFHLKGKENLSDTLQRHSERGENPLTFRLHEKDQLEKDKAPLFKISKGELHFSMYDECPSISNEGNEPLNKGVTDKESLGSECLEQSYVDSENPLDLEKVALKVDSQTFAIDINNIICALQEETTEETTELSDFEEAVKDGNTTDDASCNESLENDTAALTTQ